MTRATCCDCGAVYDADLPEDAAGAMAPYEDVADLCPGDEVPAGRCTALVADQYGGEPVPCGMSCFLDRARSWPKADDLYNDLAAYEVARDCVEACIRLHGLMLENGEIAVDMDAITNRGAGAVEETAVVVWLKERIAETENTIDGLETGANDAGAAVVVKCDDVAVALECVELALNGQTQTDGVGWRIRAGAAADRLAAHLRSRR